MAKSNQPAYTEQSIPPREGSSTSTTTATPTLSVHPEPQYRLLLPEQASLSESEEKTVDPSLPPPPLVICFHGSGSPASCSPAWDQLTSRLLLTGLRVMLCDRGPANPSPRDAAAMLRAHLRDNGVRGPYVLVAHSYGGAFARMFLHVWEGGGQGKGKGIKGRGGGRDDIAGMVLVETGQEGGLDPEVEEHQLRRHVLGSRPLVVVRGNSLLGKWRELERAEEEGIEGQREMLRRCDEEDRRLKRRQLALSACGDGSRVRFVEIPDCGHNVVADRPETVAEAVEWVVRMLGEEEEGDATRNGRSWWRMMGKNIKGLTRR
ncbi:alpha/beta-hydrolase [Camillea tinctor]|nr:alpha/beta-hydrolase [Camillea tinctor]